MDKKKIEGIDYNIMYICIKSRKCAAPQSYASFLVVILCKFQQKN